MSKRLVNRGSFILILIMIIFTENDARRFWSKVEVGTQDECWEWLAAKDKGGYGVFSFCSKRWYAHRVSVLLNCISGRLKHRGEHTCYIPPESLLRGPRIAYLLLIGSNHQRVPASAQELVRASLSGRGHPFNGGNTAHSIRL